MELELKNAFQEYDKTFQESKQIIGDEISDFCNSQQPLDHTLTADGPSPVTQNINDNTPCGCEIDGKTFCNFDYGHNGTCESCDNHKDATSCEHDGLPDKGAIDCKKRCFNDTTPLKPKLPDCTKSQVKSFITNTKSDFLTIDQMCGNIQVDSTKCKIDMTDVHTCREALDKCETNRDPERCRDVIQECKPADNCIYNDFYKLDTFTNKICRRESTINKCNSYDLLKYFKSNVTEPECPLLPKENISDDKNYKNSYCDLYQKYKDSEKCSTGFRSDQDVICKGRFCYNAKTKKLCKDE